MLQLGIYCPGKGGGGPWRYVHSIIGGLDPDSIRLTLFCDIEGGYPGRPDIKIVPLKPVVSSDATTVIEPIVAPASRSSWLPTPLKMVAGFFKDARRLARLFREHPVDILHTQNTGCEESPVAAKLAGIPHVIGTFHVDSTYDLHQTRSGSAHRILEMVSNRCLDQAIAVSQATKRDWLQRTHIPSSRVVTIHNGIDLNKFRRRQIREQAREHLGLPVDAILLGGLGRLDEAKGFRDLIAATAKLQTATSNLYLVIAGDGGLKESLLQQAKDLGVNNRFRLLGFQNDVQRVLDALDLFVMPSLCETFGYALLEAMATELPVVATRVGGIPEVVVDGETGFLVPKRDPVALANKLALLLAHPKLRSCMGAAGRQRVKSYFDEEQMVRETIAMYRCAY